jgi:spectinomycin phosphotransferase
VQLPPALHSRIPVESWSPEWRDRVVRFQEMVAHRVWSDPTALRLAELMNTHREIIRNAVERAARLAKVLQDVPLAPLLCHADIHAGNLLLAQDGQIYIVDWDSPVLAPRERDLMFIGAGIGGIWNTEREQALFYQGYGAVEISQPALAYYRWERIVQDIAAFCEQILLGSEAGEDRQQGLVYFAGQFEPGEVIETALKEDRGQ